MRVTEKKIHLVLMEALICASFSWAVASLSGGGWTQGLIVFAMLALTWLHGIGVSDKLID